MHDLHALPDLTPETLHVRPLAQADTIPSSWYTDSRFLPVEQDVLFGRTWQYVGHRSQLPEAGAYVLASVAGNPLVLVRGHDGEVRAFYNVCRHRGGPLAMEEQGCVTMLQCKYHGWTYRLDGTLRGVPRFDRTELFDKRDYGLIPVTVHEWEGLLFVNLAGGDVALETVLDGIAERIAPMRLGAMAFARRVHYDVACNWKVYVDNYLEGYHIPLVHPELCKVLDYRAYLTETHAHYSLQHSPLRVGDAPSPYGVADGEAYYYFVFPNTMLNVLPGRLQVNRVVPVGHDRCRVDFDYYYDDVTSDEAQQRIAHDLAFSDAVQAEDAGICEHVQRGLASRGYDRGRFSVECEGGVYHFQCLLKAAFREALAAPSNGVAVPHGPIGLAPTNE
jgi:choline monooxygenase